MRHHHHVMFQKKDSIPKLSFFDHDDGNGGDIDDEKLMPFMLIKILMMKISTMMTAS